MKEDLSQENSEERTEQTAKHRKQRMQRNRAIRKQKVVSCEIGLDLRTTSVRTLTLEQRNQRQKLKNREAAQKSRENKRSYLTSLEMENKELKRQLSAMRYCEQCKTELVHSTRSFPCASFKEDPLQVEELFDEELMRVSHFQEPSSLGIFLFVCMIVVCVFTLIGANPKTNSVGTKRDLIQLHNVLLASQSQLNSDPSTNNKDWLQTRNFMSKEQMEKCLATYEFDSEFKCQSLTSHQIQGRKLRQFLELIATKQLSPILNLSSNSIVSHGHEKFVLDQTSYGLETV